MERQTVKVHGHEVSYRTGGDGPVVLLIHGMAASSSSWVPVLDLLAPHVTYVAPDLPGHGRSDKPRGDYSLGAYAAFLRDLLVTLGHDRATVVGTSLGGGIAMQFAYQHPERVERLGLVCAGGLGQEVMALLKVLTVPGGEYVLPVAFQPFVQTSVEFFAGLAGRIGLRPAPVTQEIWRSYTSLIDPTTRTAFLHTLKSVIDHQGQRVSALDRTYLTERVPTLLVWGSDDPIIPVEHGAAANELMPGSRLEVMSGCGHYPYCEDPATFARLLLEFVEQTEPASIGSDDLAEMLAGVDAD